jgi:flagellar hook-basal body complex protein FliE
MNINQFIPTSGIYSNSNITSANDGSNSQTGSVDFSSVLKGELDKVNDQQVDANNTTQQFIEGQDVNIDQVMLSNSEASMSLNMAVQVRNKLVEAYQELEKMQV